MKTTYLLIEVLKETTGQNDIREYSSIIEDIHGVSTSIDTLKGVADEENWDVPLEWKISGVGRTPTASRTKGKKTEFQIITTNDYNS